MNDITNIINEIKITNINNEIRITNIINKNKRIEIDYEIKGDFKIAFIENKKFYVEYPIDITNVPSSICVIPFLANVLPIIWLYDATIYIDELDKTFYNSIDKIKQGYEKMYPMLKFKGNVIAKTLVDNAYILVDNTYKSTNKSCCFFSGGVDSYATLIKHLEEKPSLITVWGSDIKIEDEVGWNNVKKLVDDVCDKFKISNYYIKSNFKNFINTAKLTQYIKQFVKESYWHGFQHGIGLLGLASPIAYLNKISTIYFASSYSKDYPAKYCASDPTIDNHFKFATCITKHDLYEFNRLEKVKYIIDYANKNNIYPSIRVCWESNGGKNCCNCEKCFRTMYEIIISGDDPNKYGFILNKEVNKRVKKYFFYERNLSDTEKPFWREIKEYFVKNTDKYKDNKEYNWIYKIDIDRGKNKALKKIKNILKRVVRKIFKILGIKVKTRI